MVKNIDIDRLLADRKITIDDYNRLKSHTTTGESTAGDSSVDKSTIGKSTTGKSTTGKSTTGKSTTGKLAFNIIICFGVISTVFGASALLLSVEGALISGVGVGILGIIMRARRPNEWGLLGNILLLIGSLRAAGGVLVLAGDAEMGFAIVTALLAVATVAARSALLSALTALSLCGFFGSLALFGAASQFVIIAQPALTVVVFAALAFIAYQLSKRVPAKFEHVAIAFSRASVFLVNLGFWVGSLWGDALGSRGGNWDFRSGGGIDDTVFVIAWAAAIIGLGLWAVRCDRRWLVNLLVVFGAIHFYTQLFERLDANPVSFLFGGLTAIAIALALAKYNRSAAADDEPAVSTYAKVGQVSDTKECSPTE